MGEIYEKQTSSFRFLLLAVGTAGEDEFKKDFVIDLGVKYLDENEYTSDYFRLLFEIKDFKNVAHVMLIQDVVALGD